MLVQLLIGIFDKIHVYFMFYILLHNAKYRFRNKSFFHRYPFLQYSSFLLDPASTLYDVCGFVFFHFCEPSHSNSGESKIQKKFDMVIALGPVHRTDP